MRDDGISVHEGEAEVLSEDAVAEENTAQPIAPWLHTTAVLLVLLLTTVLGHMRAGPVAMQLPKPFRYLSTAMLEWLLLGSVIAGVYHRQTFLAHALWSNKASLWRSIAQGATVYLVGFLAIAVVGSAVYLTPLRTKTNETVVLGLAPHTVLEFVLWFGVSFTAGVCEELIFRGYLMQQFTAWTRRPVLAILLTAAIFGSVHLYEGLAAILPLTALAVVYGLVVQRLKGDLRAVIVAHTLQDFLVALMVLARSFVEHHPTRH